MIRWFAELLGVSADAAVAPLFILASALIGAGVAIWGILSNRKIARLKNSRDLLLDFNSDPVVDEFEAAYSSRLKKAPKHELQQLATTKLGERDSHLIREMLNRYEGMAVGIKNRVYDEMMLKESLYSTVIDTWETLLPYVEERRRQTGKHTFFMELEALVRRWRKKPLTPPQQRQ